MKRFYVSLWEKNVTGTLRFILYYVISSIPSPRDAYRISSRLTCKGCNG